MENTSTNTIENIEENPVTEVAEKPKKSKKIFGKQLGKNAFWLWIAYQTIKGTLTTSLIWVPLIYAYFHESTGK